MMQHDKLFYGGDWHNPAGTSTIGVVSASTEEVIGSVPDATGADIDAAVATARQAFDDPQGWSQWAPERRADAMDRLAAVLETHAEDFAQLVSSQNGMPIRLSRSAEGSVGPHMLRFYADMIRERGAEEFRGRSLVRSGPIGVVAAITPWNFPLGTTFLKLAPLLAAGCTAVLKPSPETVLDAFLLAQCVADAGLPSGVVNILPGGRDIGAYLVGHPDIDKVSFTGSTAGGRSVAQRCAELIRPVTLELGGKSAAIVLDDADLISAREDFLYSTMCNSGQTCWISTRILVPRSRLAKFTDTITDLVASQPIGNALDEATEIGPMTSSAHRDRVEGYMKAGLAEGARLTLGGGRPKGEDRGWFVEPTIFADVDNTSVIAREEIFGPVLCVIAYDDVDDAIAMANDSRYGLGGTVWTADHERGVDVARRLRTGTVGINSFQADLAAPFGGVKGSGLGRELGVEGLSNYQVLQSIYPHPGQPWPPVNVGALQIG